MKSHTKEFSMHKLLLSTAAFAALAGSAFAADLPSVKEAPVIVAPTPVFTWTGFYVGADIGSGWANRGISVPPGPLNPQDSFGTTARGIVGGGFAGYNYQINQFVIGVQGDIQGADITGTSYSPLLDVTTSPNQNWLAAVNGRLGFVYDRALIYAIGGVAFTDVSDNVSAGNLAAGFLLSNGIVPNSQKISHSATGYDIGGGVEYAVAPNWTIRAEYRYYNFGSWTGNASGWVPRTSDHTLNESTVTFGLSYLFGAQPVIPVLAKY
jgi:outer membrane immunogenic protein